MIIVMDATLGVPRVASITTNDHIMVTHQITDFQMQRFQK